MQVKVVGDGENYLYLQESFFRIFYATSLFWFFTRFPRSEGLLYRNTFYIKLLKHVFLPVNDTSAILVCL